MKKNILVLIGFLAGSCAWAVGGMIGGGDVDLKSIMTCSAQGMDPIHEGTSFVEVAKEVDYYGEVIPDSTLRVVTLNKNHKPISYYVTHVTELLQDSNLKWSFNLWQYDIGSQGHKKIGLFVWDESVQRGHLSVLSQNSTKDIMLYNCHQ